MKNPKFLIGILGIFLAIMAAATYTAYSRRSGNTGIDMAKISFLRNQNAKNKG